MKSHIFSISLDWTQKLYVHMKKNQEGNIKEGIERHILNKSMKTSTSILNIRERQKTNINLCFSPGQWDREGAHPQDGISEALTLVWLQKVHSLLMYMCTLQSKQVNLSRYDFSWIEANLHKHIAALTDISHHQKFGPLKLASMTF